MKLTSLILPYLISASSHHMEFCIFKLIPDLLVGFLFFIGLISAFLPIIPSSMIIWLGIFIHKMWTGDQSISWTLFAILTGLAILTQLIDWGFAYWGARKFGGSWRGGLGAILGLIIGPFIFTPLIGIIIGPIIGAIFAELLGGQRLRHAGKAGLGTIVGGLIAFVLKLSILCFMIGLFYFYTL